MISLIVAMDKNNVIGYKNDLPWHLPADLKYFKKITTGHPIIMGRKTRDSIGRNLPNRENIVITRNKEYRPEGCTVFYSIEDWRKWSQTQNEEEMFIIGGAEIFKETLSFTDRLYITKIDAEYPGDTFFPEMDWGNWKLVSEVEGQKDENNSVDYQFLVYERIKN
ncbi:dihydrofolate reductase [Niallia nealsonii]|uniref:Dihydrofolate reductase n=1 Tax=Niallia nealsonii TaxID=115979 RepID=A0A2N0Z3E9_9BACI|nr:dihydrofolate reductase [Niallia nealsonii]PKG24030.1 dihydrofolate reductase [Niallia nealsonii]